MKNVISERSIILQMERRKLFAAIETMNQFNYLECLFHLGLWLSFGTSFQPLKEISVDNSEFHFY